MKSCTDYSGLKKFIIAIAFGLLGFGLNFTDVQLFESPAFKVNVLPGLVFPLLISIAWGWRYGLLSALAGGCQSMWWLWKSDGYGLLYSVPVFTVWILWHGYWSDRRLAAKESWLLSPVVVEIPFRIVCELGFYTVFRWLVSLNPPLWDQDATWNYVQISWVNTVAVKHVVTAYILLLVVQVCLSLGPIRRFLLLPRRVAQKETTAIYSGALLGGFLLWFLDALVECCLLRSDKSFWEAVALDMGPHELFTRVLFLVFSVVAAVFVARFVRHRTELRVRLDHQNRVLASIRNVNQLITHQKDRALLLEEACKLLVETRGFFNAWFVGLDNGKPVAPLFRAGFNGQFTAMAEYLEKGFVPQCVGEAIATGSMQVVDNPHQHCFECPLAHRDLEHAGFTMVVEHNDVRFGVLSVSMPRYFAQDKTEQDLFKELCKDIAFALWSLENEVRRRETEKEYALVLQSTSDAVIALDFNETVQLFNTGAERMLGVSAAQALGVSLLRFVPEEMKEQQRALMEKAKTGEAVQGVETELLAADGRRVPVEMTLNVQTRDDGRHVGLSAILRDVGERRRAQEALRLHQHITSTLPHPMAFVDGTYRYRAVNDIYAALYGTDAANIIGRGVFEFYEQDFFEREIKPNIDRCLAGERIRYEVYVEFPGLGRRWMEMIYCPYRGSDGVISGVVAHGTDFTDRKLAEIGQKESQKRFERMLSMIPDMVSIHDAEMNIVYSNWNGVARVPMEKRWIGGKCHEIYHGLEDVCPDCKALHVLRTNEPFQGEIRLADNTWADMRIIPLLDTWGEVELFVVWMRDITDSKRAQEALRESEQRFRKVIEDLPGGVFVHDLEGRFIFVNGAACRNTGWSKEELLAMRVSDLDPHSQPRKDDEVLWLKMDAASRMTLESEHKRKDGSTYPVEIHLNSITLEGRPVMLAMAFDITERKMAEEERARLLSHVEAKNGELEQLLYVASHDLRSPLVNIEGYCRELEHSVKELDEAVKDVAGGGESPALRLLMREEIPEALRFIRQSAVKMDTLLTGLLRLSRTGRATLLTEQLDMDALMSQVVNAMEFQIKQSAVTLEIEALPTCWGDAVQVNQVFTNLLDNALKYLKPEGQGVIRVSGKIQDGNAVYCVEDNGIGMNKDQAEKIFEIFYRINPSVGAGDGLGLSIVKRIMDRLEGKIWVESSLDAGSRFFVALPFSGARA